MPISVINDSISNDLLLWKLSETEIQLNNLVNLSTKQIGLLLSIFAEIAGEYESLLLERKRMMFIINNLNENKDNI